MQKESYCGKQFELKSWMRGNLLKKKKVEK